jgi:quercetin dioxygenase-like cupin family protein
MPRHPVWFMDTLVEVNIDGAETGSAYAVATFTSPPGHMPPPHVHANEAEGLLVLEGELSVHTAAGSHVLRPGDAMNAPRGEPHTVEVTSPVPARYVVVSAPAGFVAFVCAFGTPAERRELPVLSDPLDLERLTRTAAEHGITFVGPPGARPVDLDAGHAS